VILDRSFRHRSGSDGQNNNKQVPGQPRRKEKPMMSSPTRTVEEIPAQPRSAGALTFAPDGMLFVGDGKSSAIFAYPNLGPAASSETVEPFLFEDIDRRTAEALQVNERALTYNGMAVHPLTREPHISRRHQGR
jgi:hypothetical protein